MDGCARSGRLRVARRGLRDTLRRVLQLAVDERADALFCGGDLYEHEHFTSDTVEFVRRRLRKSIRCRSTLRQAITIGSGPRACTARQLGTPNVHVFDRDRLQPATLADGLTLWGGAHVVPANSDNFLENFRVDRGGLHLALFHGSEQGRCSSKSLGKAPHAPFRGYQIADSGLDHAFLGHFHTPVDAPSLHLPRQP